MFISTAVAGLIAVLLAGPPEPVGGPDRVQPGRPLPVGNVAHVGHRSTDLPKPSRTVKIGADGVPQEIVVVPFPIDDSGVPSAPIAIPDFGIPDLKMVRGPVRRKNGKATAPQWRDRNWNSAWEIQRPARPGQAKRPAKQNKRAKQIKNAKRHKSVKQNKRAKRHDRRHGTSRRLG